PCAAGEAEAEEDVAHLGEMPAELDDGGGVDAGEPALERRRVESGRDYRQRLVASGERRAAGGGTGGERRDAWHDIDMKLRRKAAEEIHEGAVEEGVALAQHRNVLPGCRFGADLARRAVIDILRREALGHHRHADDDLALRAGEELG